MTDDDDLEASVLGLGSLVNADRSLEQTLEGVAGFAVRAIPGAEGAGVTVLNENRPKTVVSSAPFVQEVDDLQYGLGEGPCVLAMAESRTVSSGSLGGEPLWPRFGPRAGRFGVHSALSVPLLVPGRVVGALNVYARDTNAFGDRSLRLAELFAQPAAVTVDNARVLAETRRLVEQLQAALTSRATIDRAIGIVISRTGGNEAEAFARLRDISQRRNVKLAIVAADLVQEAAARARSRHAGTPAGEPIPPRT